ncbi:DUF927 domain-containing protein [Desulforamulus hydrothermalis]|uniref:Superfamily II helicase and inactivated derivatives-like protein n=1 Tax=Desulforamulus hydrothermalis Lam5 = DSM 18033 TaxID=1121428 RepID=K8DZ27_9FIRM|nr:DUF927 domain-containing protein [Desulforamulus hydrothermalis]CCO08257.1 Superfamily II helicase and inactivated derivatives-like protein [Desulforamulus hydrothermalis Lam5 = DSM 18033]SHH43895.1 protein of unknown function [Desulforamulus hydrothermalis Lam5 = DSM 18033]
MNKIQDFLSSLYGYFDPGSVLYLWTLPDKQTHPFTAGTLAEMATAAGRLTPSYDVYFGVGATVHSLGQYERPKNEDIMAIPGLWVDIDVYHPVAHKSKALPPDINAAMELLPNDLPPSIITWSGYGIHAYWLFREPWEFNAPEERARAAKLLQSLQAVVKQNAAARGWRIDPTADLARVLRLPGTLNKKIPDSPVQCRVIERSELRYNPSDIEDLLPPVPDNPVHHRTEKFERRPTDGPAELMLRNCRFLQHCQLNAKDITYAEWLAMLTNVARASDGIHAAHQISALDPERYRPEDTDKKLAEALAMNPQTCEYIRTVVGFPGCPQGGCGVQAPCSWSLSKVGKARAVVRGISIPTPETVLTQEVLGALALLKKEDQIEYAKFKATCKGRVNLNDLEKMVKQYKKQVRQESHLHVVQDGEKPGTRMLSNTVPEIPLDLVLPPNFRFEKSGILYVRETSSGDIQAYKAVGTPAIISERLFNVDTETEKLEICFQYLNGWRKVLFPRSTVMDSRKILRLADFGVAISSESAKYTVKWFDVLLDVNQDRIPVTQAVSKLGWRGDREFVLPNFSPHYRIDIDDDGSQRTISGFTTVGDRSEWIARMQYLRQSPKARFILAASFAAPLLRILGQRNFIIHNWGNSQDGKTATLWAAMSVWGNPDRLISTFDTTTTAMERKAALHSDLPLAINEREVLSRGKKDDINPLLYTLGEGRGRNRADKKGLQITATWRTIALSTGEGTLSNTGSFDGVMTRVLEISDGPLAHDRDFARNLYYFLPRNHGHAGPEFLSQLLAADYGTIFATYREFQSVFRASYQDRIDSHIDAVACVATADYLTSAWVFGEPWEQAKAGAMATGGHILTGLITKKEASESERAWEAFKDWIAENQAMFKERTNGPCFGYIEKGDMPFDKPDFYVIRSVVDQFLSERFSSSRKIIREWALTGKIESYNHGGKIRYDAPGRVLESGVRARVIKIREVNL